MLYQLFWLFLAFSFLGWYLEVAATAVRLGQYREREAECRLMFQADQSRTS